MADGDLSPELALVCPVARADALALLPDRDPFAFLDFRPRPVARREPARVAARSRLSPVATPAQIAPALDLPCVAEGTPVARRPAVASSATPQPSAPARAASARPAPVDRASLAALFPERSTSSDDAQAAPGRLTVRAYLGRELALFGIAAGATLGGLTGSLALIDVFITR